MMDQGKPKRQEVKLLNRKELEITGVKSVESFDSEAFMLATECGLLHIRGQNLHIKHLSLEQGFVAIDGSVHSLEYLDGGMPHKSKSLFGKLFK